MKTLKMAVLAMVVALNGMNIYNSHAELDSMDYLTLENVEAIADDNESIVEFPCISQESEDCKFLAKMADGTIVPSWINGYVNKLQ